MFGDCLDGAYNGAMSTKKPVEKQKAGGLILIVDDEPKNLQFMGTILRHSNYEIEFASSGKLALKKMRANKPDLILLDVMMPGMDGWQVCGELRADKELKDIPVIFMTALTSQEDVMHCFEVGGSDYVSKPFQVAELLARVNTNFELKRSRDQITQLKERLRNYEDAELMKQLD